jgi:hypothetical protein
VDLPAEGIAFRLHPESLHPRPYATAADTGRLRVSRARCDQ